VRALSTLPAAISAVPLRTYFVVTLPMAHHPPNLLFAVIILGFVCMAPQLERSAFWTLPE